MKIFDSTLIRDNSIYETGLEEGYENYLPTLLNMIKSNGEITGLDIRGRDITPEQFLLIFEALQDNSTVETLILRGGGYPYHFPCDMSNSIIYQGLSKLLYNNKNIKSLTLYHTNIQDNGIEDLAETLERNNTLKYFKVCGHRITDVGGDSIVKMLKVKMSERNTDLSEIIVNHPIINEAVQLSLSSYADHVMELMGLNENALDGHQDFTL